MTPARSRPGGEAGSISLELTLLLVLLFVPLLYLGALVGRLQASASTAADAAEAAVRAATSAPWNVDPLTAGEAAGAAVLRAQQQPGRVLLGCEVDPCRRADALVTATAQVPVDVPLLPGRGGVIPPTVRVTARAAAAFDRFADAAAAAPGGS